MSRDVSELVSSAMPIAMSLVVRFEGLHLRPYLDPVGIPTIGLGTTVYPNGRRVTLLDSAISEEEAIILAKWYLRSNCLPVILKVCPELDTPEKLAAILDWSYNLGVSRLYASTMRRRINQKRWSDVRYEITRWVYARGRKLRGLELRRAAEAALIQV